MRDNTSISGLIKYGKSLDINHEKMCFKSTLPKKKDTDDKVIINTRYMLDTYLEYFSDYITSYTMTDDEFAKYKYQPKLFCQEVYDTPEIWASLLRINYMTSSLEFKKKKIKAFRTDVFDLINEMFILEEYDYLTNANQNK